MGERTRRIDAIVADAIGDKTGGDAVKLARIALDAHWPQKLSDLAVANAVARVES